MVAAAILDFQKFHFCPRGSMMVSAGCILFKFGENRLILVETIDIFVNTTWRP